MRSAIAFLLLCFASSGAPHAAEPVPEPVAPSAAPAAIKTKSDVFAALATLKGLEADFVETKRLALLAAPLTSKGTLYFERPGRLARHVTEPSRSQVVITPERLEMTDASGKTERLELGSRPDVKLFVESFVKVLAGDEASLSSLYAIRFTPAGEAAAGAAHWRMTLTPKASGPRGIGALIAKLEITGTGPRVEAITVVETSGDSTLTTITRADPTRRFTDAERASLFRVTPGGR